MGRLSDYRDLDIDWTMTPEDAVTMYLEWGNNSWRADRQPVRSKDDVSTYFVVSTWSGKPLVRLVRRSSQGAEELAELELPDAVGQEFREDTGELKGLYPVDASIRSWLERELYS
ncbi:MAG: DVU0772 family protein [Desulfovibrionaceae bacterium]